MEHSEKQRNPEEIISEFEDLRGVDLSERDLRTVPVEVLITADFDTKTIWPGQDKLSAGFNPEKIISEAKNPGLGIEELHAQGIDGRGVRVAIIDQTLSSENGELIAHSEYASKIIDYREFGDAKGENVSMHGPAVASLLVGETCGVAPGAELVYRATPSGRDFNHKADALLDLINFNKTLPSGNKIRIVNCSIGYMEEKYESGLERWIEAIKKAEAEGIIVSDVGDRTGVDYIGGGASGNKNNPENYDRPLFSKDKEDEELNKIFAESGGNSEREKEIVIPCDYRSMVSNTGPDEYMYKGKGGVSWSVPYLTGLFALAFQVNPNLTKKEIANAINKTAIMNKRGLKVVNPKVFIDAIRI